MAGKGFHVDPGHLHRSGGKLGQFGEKLGGHGQRLHGLGEGLLAHTRGDRSGIGSVISRVFGRALGITGKVFGEGGRVVGEAGKRLQHTAKTFEHVEARNKGLLSEVREGGKRLPHVHSGGGKRGGSGSAASGGGRKTFRSRVRDGLTRLRDKARGKDTRVCKNDPVDVASGEMVLSQTDVELDGLLSLVLSRTHVSSYRVGQWFGPSWASTVDQRLEVDDEGVCFVSEDGMLLVYPHPDGGAVLPAEGPRWPLTRTDDGYLVSDHETGRTLHFAGAGPVLPLAAITDRNLHRIEFDYEAEGVLVGVRHSGGYRVGVDTVDGLVTALRLRGADGGGGDVVLMRYGYDEARRLVEVVNSSGLALRLDYDPDGRITGWQDRNGAWYRYVYDEQGRCVQNVGSDGFMNGTFAYDAENLVTTFTDSLGNVTTYHLNDAHQVVREIDPLGHETVSEWDRYDRLLSRTDPLGRTTRYTYDDVGNLVVLTCPDGSQATATYNHLRQPVTVTDPDGAQWRYDYDERGNLIAFTDPAGVRTHYRYDERGYLREVVDVLGNVRRVETNAAGLTLAVTDPLGARTRYVRDAFGRVSAVTDSAGGTTRLGWTVEGKPAWQTLPDGATERWAYDGEGNLTEHIDELGHITRIEYTHFDLAAARTSPDGARLEFTYDTNLRLISVTNPQGLVWRYDYDPADNLVRETDFNDRVLSYTYDDAGRLIERVNGVGQIATFTRDVLGRVVERRAEDGVTTFAYDEVGRLARATNQDTELLFTRDTLGQIVAETCNGRTVASTYDARGQRTRRVTPTGAETRWEYDASAQPTALHTAGQTLAFAYDGAGREITRQLGAVTLAQSWDANHRLHTQALTAPDSGSTRPGAPRQQRLVQRRAYTYRADGAVTNIVDQLAGVRHFDLDPLGRVTQVEGPGYREQYAYDPSGNIAHAAWPTPHAEPAAVGPRVHTGTLLRSAGNTRYEHDGQGRVIARHARTLSGQTRTWRYAWDSDDRLIAVTTPDGVTWRYTYDPLGRRTAKLRLGPSGDITERVDFTWDGTTLAEQTHISGHTTTWNYQPGRFTPLTQTERAPLRNAPQEWIDQQFYAIVTDLVGTPTELVDRAGSLAWRHTTTLWGAPLAAARQRAYCPLRFPGQYHDPETGFNYNYYRYYDPADGTYTSSDPLGLDAGPNPHTYVANPTSWIDPLGLLSCSENAEKLARNMAREGRPKGPGQAAAHIVPSGFKRGGGPAMRALLQRYGVDVNDAANGIPLGHPIPHNFTHHNNFLGRVQTRLEDVVQQRTADGHGARAIRTALRRELRSIGREIEAELATGRPGAGAYWTAP